VPIGDSRFEIELPGEPAAACAGRIRRRGSRASAEGSERGGFVIPADVRGSNRATIMTSQVDPKQWHQLLRSAGKGLTRIDSRAENDYVSRVIGRDIGDFQPFRRRSHADTARHR
jgi:hypothetical protein